MGKLLRYGSKGPAVKRLQAALNATDRIKLRRLLKLDGEMGPLTCAAIQQAKHRLGYPPDRLDPDVEDQVAGDLLFDLLTGRRRLPPDYAKRRKARLAKLRKSGARSAMRRKALTIIRGELGELERGGHGNRIKYNDWWGWGAVAYCVIGLSWAWVKAGSKAFVKGARWAGTDLMLADAKAGRHGIHLTSDPDPGCPGVIDFDGHSDPDHAVTFVKDNGDGTCQTIEFNTSAPNGLEGVFNKRRPLRNCWWFEVEV